jgi:hypothetical protein
MSLLIVMTLGTCGHSTHLNETGLFLQLADRLMAQGISFKRLNAANWPDLGIENGPRDTYHRKILGHTPLFALAPEGKYNSPEVTDDELLSQTHVFNATIENGRVRYASPGRTPNLDNIMEFVTTNAVFPPEIKEPAVL